MKMTLIEWALYPNTEEAQHVIRFERIKKKVTQLVKTGYTEKVKRIFVLMGFNKVYDLEDKPKHLIRAEKYINILCENKTIAVQELESIIYPDYPPAPALNPFEGKRFA